MIWGKLRTYGSNPAAPLGYFRSDVSHPCRSVPRRHRDTVTYDPDESLRSATTMMWRDWLPKKRPRVW